MKHRAVILFWVCIVAGGHLHAQESPYLFQDVTASHQPATYKSTDIHGNVVKIIESQDYRPNPNHDLYGHYLVYRDEKYSKHILYTTTPQTTTTFSFDSAGTITGVDQTVIEKTFYKRVKTEILTRVNDQRSANRRRRPRHSGQVPTLSSSQIILNHFTFQNGLPVLWEQKKGEQGTWVKMEALRYDSLLRIKSVYHYENNHLEEITTYTYDDQNRIVTEKRVPFTIKIKDPPTLHKQYSYDDLLNSTQVIDLLRDSLTSPFTASRRFTSQYDSEGRLQMVEGEHLGYYNAYPQRCCSISSTIKKVTFRYDDHGALTEKCYYTGGEMMLYRLAWEYKYDERGNWVQCKHYEDDHILNVTNRTIVYP